MYSMVLMAALATAGDTPACHFKHASHACYGGCYGSSCYGCYGSYSCYGTCYGGCYGVNPHGACYGSYACYGASCYGCAGCYGGGYPAYGCFGSCYGCHGCYGCWGCFGGAACYGSSYGCVGAVGGVEYAPATPSMPSATPPAGTTPAPAVPPAGQASLLRSTLTVEVPADAKLYIDDQLMKTPATSRTFNTPLIERGQTYYYILKAELVRDGKTIAETKRVLLTAGEQVKATFTEESIVAASGKPTTVAAAGK